MVIPKDCRYTRDHEWAKMEDGIATIGITDYAQEKLGEIVYVELPGENDEVRKDEAFGVVESTKNASDVLSPMSGKVVEVNDVLEDNPELINNDPYEEGWIIKIQAEDAAEFEEMLSMEDYREFLESIDSEGDEG